MYVSEVFGTDEEGCCSAVGSALLTRAPNFTDRSVVVQVMSDLMGEYAALYALPHSCVEDDELLLGDVEAVGRSKMPVLDGEP